MKCAITITLLICCMQIHSQDSSSTQAIELPPKYLSSVDRKIESLDDNLSKQTDKYLNSLSKREEKLFKRLARLDSSKAAAIFGDTKKTYEELSQKFNHLNGKFDKLTSGQYLSGLDSLQGSLAFLKDAKNILSKSKGIRDKLGSSLNQVNQLQNKLKGADDIKALVQQRQEQIKQLLSSYTNLPKGISKCFGKYQSEVYYYSQTIKDCRELLNDPDKLISKVLSTLQSIPSFQKFFSRYSMLASLFPTPDNYGTPQALAGLQTRASVQQLMQQQLPTSATGGNPAQYLQQQLQQAQGELSKLKDKLNQLDNGSGNSSDLNMPDNFKPSAVKTKPFWKRIEFGTNFQTQRATNYFVTTTDIAATAGFKLNDKSIIGIGISGKIGWGKDWKHIKLSGQGVGFRAFADMKIPSPFGGAGGGFMGSLWLTGGAEMNYTRTIESLSVFKNYSNWSKSALIGLTKKYSISSPLKKGKKVQGTISVLYDALYNKHVPPTPALVWRVGYGL